MLRGAIGQSRDPTGAVRNASPAAEQSSRPQPNTAVGHRKGNGDPSRSLRSQQSSVCVINEQSMTVAPHAGRLIQGPIAARRFAGAKPRTFALFERRFRAASG